MNNLCSKDSLPQHGDKESGGGDTDTPKGFIQSHQTFINIVSGEVGRHVPALLFIPFIFLTLFAFWPRVDIITPSLLYKGIQHFSNLNGQWRAGEGVPALRGGVGGRKPDFQHLPGPRV